MIGTVAGGRGERWEERHGRTIFEKKFQSEIWADTFKLF